MTILQFPIVEDHNTEEELLCDPEKLEEYLKLKRELKRAELSLKNTQEQIQILMSQI